MTKHILGSAIDPIILARLRAVSPVMRNAVDATGMRVGKEDTAGAAHLGYLDTLKHLLQKGRLDKTVVCSAAALGGLLGVLQWARANSCPWDEKTCAVAAKFGNLRVLQ